MSTAAVPAGPGFDRVIVGVGAETRAPGLLRTAGQVAERFDVPVELVTVIAGASDELPDRRRFLMRALAAEHGLDDVECTVLTSWSVADALVTHVNEAAPALLIVATSVRSRADDLLVGSTVGGVLHRITTPALVLGPAIAHTSDPFEGPIVVTGDGSPESESIIPLVQRWSQGSSQPRWVVSQVDEDATLDPALEQRGAHRMAQAIGDDVEWEVLRGSDPGQGIARFAAEREAGLVVMATHGRSALGRAALGSTTMRVVHLAHCPVLVHRPTSVPLEPFDSTSPADAAS